MYKYFNSLIRPLFSKLYYGYKTKGVTMRVLTSPIRQEFIFFQMNDKNEILEKNNFQLPTKNRFGI